MKLHLLATFHHVKRESKKGVSLLGLFLLLSSICGSLILLSGCSSSTVKLDADWAEYYTSLKDLKQHSDIAVFGSVSSVAPAVKPADGEPVYSMISVTVSQVLWQQSQKTYPSTITFEQTGGIYDNITYQISDDPLFQKGDQVVVFFREYAPGKYKVSGGPSGRFSVQSGIVRPIAADAVKVAASTDVTHFADMIKSS